ncbi:hypothetical protein [Erythrobacter sp. BLCC-B19]|uniref:hypothetical protein n=1 Tax=Erythrobacter sp. BLCC-B19 TaxID=3025315 RepID=UPI002362303A|nr:hypothetical protein [Erythrobacter sp. BLCC-B19]WDA41911.1 hypothetical protein PS060_03630 [Erythrobacter sp. BLCC-B19]
MNDGKWWLACAMMRRPAILALCGVLAGCASAPSGSEPPSLSDFAASELGVSAYKSASADLNGDGVDEIILRADAPEWCGSGGCTLFVLEKAGSTFRLVSRTTVTQLPIRLLDTKTNGWRDLSVGAHGGGVMEARNAQLRFDGNAYPGNPTIPPATPISQPSGTILIR